jgi:hypothetical protein
MRSAYNSPATESQCRTICRLTGFNPIGTLLTCGHAGDMIGRLIQEGAEAREEIAAELGRLGAAKVFERTSKTGSGLGFQIVYDQALAEAKRKVGEAKGTEALVVLGPATKAFPKWLLATGRAAKHHKLPGAVLRAPSIAFAEEVHRVLVYHGHEAEILV